MSDKDYRFGPMPFGYPDVCVKCCLVDRFNVGFPDGLCPDCAAEKAKPKEKP